MQRKTASFLGSAGASLVDLDDLFSSNPKPRQYPLKDWTSTQTQATGKDRKTALQLWMTNNMFDKDFTCGYFWLT